MLLQLWAAGHRPAGEKKVSETPKLIWRQKSAGSVGKGKTQIEAKDKELLGGPIGQGGKAQLKQLRPSSQPFLYSFLHTCPAG